MKAQAVIFDFDYTLADSEAAIVSCFRTVLDAHHASPADIEISRTIGQTLEEAFGILLGEYDPTRLAALRREYVAIADRRMVAMTEFYPGALALLRRLRVHGVKVGLFSTKYRYRVMASFERFGVESLIDDAVGGEDVDAHKPDPKGLKLWLDRNKIAASDAVYVGDHLVDAEAARRAGVGFVGVTQGNTSAAAMAEYPNLGIAERIDGVWDILQRYA